MRKLVVKCISHLCGCQTTSTYNPLKHAYATLYVTESAVTMHDYRIDDDYEFFIFNLHVVDRVIESTPFTPHSVACYVCKYIYLNSNLKFYTY